VKIILKRSVNWKIYYKGW